MPAPTPPGPIPRAMIYINGAEYRASNIHDLKVDQKLNQVGVGRATLNLTSSTLLVDGGNVLVCDHVNNFGLTGKVKVRDEVIRYTGRTEINPITRFETELATYISNPGGYTPPDPLQFELTGLTRGDEGTPQGTHPYGSRVFIHPGPEEGDDISVYLGGRLIMVGVVSHVERIEITNEVQVDFVGIATRIRDIQVTTKTIHKGARTGELLNLLVPPGWDSDIELGIKMDYRMELGNNLMHLANLCLMSGFDWWVTTEDDVHTIHCRSYRGSTIPKATWTPRLTALELTRSASKDDIYNSITAIGSSSEMQGTSTTLNANTRRITRLASSESVLAENIVSTDTSFDLESALNYAVGDIIQIGDEKMTISGKSGNLLTVTRGTGGTVAVAHHVGDPVLEITGLSIESMSDLSQGMGNPQYVWIGSEKIRVTGVYGSKLQNLTRGVDDTTPYAHKSGTLVLSADSTNEDPEPLSSIGLYGERGIRQSVIGAADRDGLDKWAGAALIELKDLLPGGSFRVPLASFPATMDVGDTFTLLEYAEAGSTNHRVTGLTWDLSGTVKVEFGHPEDWVLADFADAAKAMQLATQKSPPAAQGLVIQTSPDGKMVQVQGADGPIWVRVQL